MSVKERLKRIAEAREGVPKDMPADWRPVLVDEVRRSLSPDGQLRTYGKTRVEWMPQERE